jgi:hypothetical protein
MMKKFQSNWHTNDSDSFNNINLVRSTFNFNTLSLQDSRQSILIIVLINPIKDKKMKRHFLITFAILFSVMSVKAQSDGLKYINENDLKAYMNFLSSDEMKGRETGKPENDIAARYIAANLMRFGLKPLPGTDSYLQTIPFVSRSIDKSSTSLTATSENGKTLVKTDSIISLIPSASDIEVTGDLVFAGYGFEDKSTGYNDLKDMDLTDKVVLVMTRNPNISNDPKYAAGYLFEEKVEVPKIMALFSKKPKAVLMVYDAKNHFHDVFSSGLADMLGGNNSVSLAGSQGMSLPIKTLLITGYTADQLLVPSGQTLKQLQDKIDSEKKPASTVINGVKVSFKIAMKSSEFKGYNVVGIVEGSDPVLKNECIVYSAHFDHLGVNGKGEVFNGADDNASGSIGILEAADAFSHLKKKPLRSVVFVWVTGEEKGLLGSQYYVNHPVIAMDKTILDINLDMIGRTISPADTGSFMGIKPNVTGKDEIMLYNEGKSTQLLKMVTDASAKTGVKVDNKGKNMELGGSDHQSFGSKKVTWLFFHSGIHTDLHTIRDDADKIDYDKMEKVTKLVYLVGYNVANSKEGIKMDQVK